MQTFTDENGFFDNEQALKEGWALFDDCGEGDLNSFDVPRIERLDEEEVFQSDPEAWSWILRRLFEDNSPYHAAALLHTRHKNPVEFLRIEHHSIEEFGRSVGNFLDARH